MRLGLPMLFLALVAVLLPGVADANTGIGNLMQFPSSCSGLGVGQAQQNCPEFDSSGKIFTPIACKVMSTLNAAVFPLYCGIVNNPEFQGALSALFTMFMAFLAIAYITGIAPNTKGHVVGKMIRFSVVFAFVVNSDLFLNVIYGLIVTIPDEGVRVVLSASGSGASNFFEYVDEGMFNVIDFMTEGRTSEASGATKPSMGMSMMVVGLAIWKLVPGGDYIAGIFMGVLAGWLVAYLMVMVRYLLAMMVLVFLTILGPLLMPTLLFEKLKFVGEEWIKMISSFIIQMIIVVLFVVMVEGFFTDFVKMIEGGFKEFVVEGGVERNTATVVNPGDPDTGEGRVVETPARYTPLTTEEAENVIGQMGYTVPEFFFKMLVMAVIVFLTFSFMQEVPAMAGFLAANPKFVKIMRLQGGNRGGIGDDKAPLFLQKTIEDKLGQATTPGRTNKFIENLAESLTK